MCGCLQGRRSPRVPLRPILDPIKCFQHRRRRRGHGSEDSRGQQHLALYSVQTRSEPQRGEEPATTREPEHTAVSYPWPNITTQPRRVGSHVMAPPELNKALAVKVKLVLSEIAELFEANEADLPFEIRRDRFLDINAFFRALNLYISGGVLDDFLSKHVDCKERVGYIFGSRYQHLDSSKPGGGGGGSSGEGPAKLLQPPGRGRDENPTSSAPWAPDLDRAGATGLSEEPQRDRTRAAVETFGSFEPVAADSGILQARDDDVAGPLTSEQLNAIEDLLIREDMEQGYAQRESAANTGRSWTELDLELEPEAGAAAEDEDEPMPDYIPEEPILTPQEPEASIEEGLEPVLEEDEVALDEFEAALRELEAVPEEDDEASSEEPDDLSEEGDDVFPKEPDAVAEALEGVSEEYDDATPKEPDAMTEELATVPEEAHGAILGEPEAIPEEVEGSAEDLEVGSEEPTVASEEAEVVSQDAEAGPEEPEVVTDEPEADSEPEVVSDGAESISREAEATPEEPDVGSEEAELVSEDAEVVSQGDEATPEEPGVDPGEPEVVYEGAEAVSEDERTVPEEPMDGVDPPPPPGPEMPMSEPEVVSEGDGVALEEDTTAPEGPDDDMDDFDAPPSPEPEMHMPEPTSGPEHASPPPRPSPVLRRTPRALPFTERPQAPGPVPRPHPSPIFRAPMASSFTERPQFTGPPLRPRSRPSPVLRQAPTSSPFTETPQVPEPGPAPASLLYQPANPPPASPLPQPTTPPPATPPSPPPAPARTQSMLLTPPSSMSPVGPQPPTSPQQTAALPPTPESQAQLDGSIAAPESSPPPPPPPAYEPPAPEPEQRDMRPVSEPESPRASRVPEPEPAPSPLALETELAPASTAAEPRSPRPRRPQAALNPESASAPAPAPAPAPTPVPIPVPASPEPARDKALQGEAAPELQLERAKAFLSEHVTLRSAEWRTRFAQVIDMTSRLQRIQDGDEPWGLALEQVLIMVRTHHAFMQYHDNRENLVGDSPEALPLPPPPPPPPQQDAKKPIILPEPKLSLHDTGDAANKAGRWTYRDVKDDSDASSPSEAVEELYRKRHQRDARSFWSNSHTHHKPKSGFKWNGSSSSKSKRLNVVECESKHFEECMRKGPSHTATVLRKAQQGQHKVPRDAEELSDDQFEALARLKGYRRAALQQTLGLFDSHENRIVGASPWQTLLPDVRESRRDELAAGRRYATKPSRPETWQDEQPSAAGQGQSQDDGRGQAAEWTKADAMMAELGKLWDALIKHRTLYDALLRTARRAPRPLIMSVVKDVRAGVVGARTGDAKQSAEPGPPRLRPLEARWLELLCQPSATDTPALKKRLSEREQLFSVSVQAMLDDPSASSLFNDMGPKMPGPFLQALNRAPQLQQRQFTVEELAQFVPRLDKMNILRTYVKDKTTPMLGRPEHTVHPEQRIRWSESGDVGKKDEQGDNAAEVQAFIKRWDRTKIFDADADEAAGSYSMELPNRNSLRSLASCVKKPHDVKADQARTEKLLSHLAHRLGSSLRALQDQHATKRHALHELLGITPGARAIHPEEHSVSYAQRAMRRRKFLPGPAEFWLGDSPLQRRRIEQQLQARLDPDVARRGKKRSWGSRLFSIFGRGKRNDGEDDGDENEEAKARFPPSPNPSDEDESPPKRRRIDSADVGTRAGKDAEQPASSSQASRAEDKGKGKAVASAGDLERDGELSRTAAPSRAQQDGPAKKRKEPSPLKPQPPKRGWFGSRGKAVPSESLKLHVMSPDDGEGFW
ncbi:hypothetical protein JDV02_009429 [Purpureocillium takamizusanense]|uniref:Uncharacterized protein n=1 Tax=Purpureocillium takamizusanense TaxID=2060973 RepID=A0A9Q8QPQ3_9HYPO|nr:uncharacterized protein JDV02_009429 [Purpureocillium takamizusanense]UNI23620.1 hypothetical protein JDV02_009429 [Purpureocillium takamizusanense]